MMIGLIALGQVQAFGLARWWRSPSPPAASLLLEIISTTLLQRVAPDQIRGRTIGMMETTSVTAYAAGSFVLPVFGASQPGARAHRVWASFMLITGVISVVLLGRWAVQEPSIVPAARRIADVGLFAGLPPARLETAMRAATVRDAKQGEVIIRQGDEADFFYIIDEGRVVVTQTARAAARRACCVRWASARFSARSGCCQACRGRRP